MKSQQTTGTFYITYKNCHSFLSKKIKAGYWEVGVLTHKHKPLNVIPERMRCRQKVMYTVIYTSGVNASKSMVSGSDLYHIHDPGKFPS